MEHGILDLRGHTAQQRVLKGDWLRDRERPKCLIDDVGRCGTLVSKFGVSGGCASCYA